MATASKKLAQDYINTLQPHASLWINNEGREGSQGATFPVIDPATTDVIANVACASIDDMTAAIDAAAQAFTSWHHTPPRTRSQILRRAFELMGTYREELAALMSYENGKGLADSYAEVSYAAEFFRWFSEEAVRTDGSYSEAPAGGSRTIVSAQPVGVAALITPWNFPAAMATRKIAPALAAGCTVVLKPASQTPLTALAVCHILKEAGVPDGVVNMVTSNHAADVSETWLNDKRVRMVSFTGSTRVGSQLLSMAAKRVLNTSMELGGNASFIVGKGADVNAAVEGVMVAKYRNGGQACTAANRIFVHEDVRDAFVDAFKEKVSELKVAPAFDGGDIGPVVDDKAYRNISTLLRSAIDDGAKVIYQADTVPSEGYFIAPTILEVDRFDVPIMTTEIFGPLAPIVTFNDDDDIVAMANSTDMGLASYVYDRDLRWAIGVAESLETGMIGVNRGGISDPAAPFGGFKHSGIGREGAREGIREFQEVQYYSVAWD